jgi:hypothetical protein
MAMIASSKRFIFAIACRDLFPFLVRYGNF